MCTWFINSLARIERSKYHVQIFLQPWTKILFLFFFFPFFPSFCANYTRIERGRNLVFHPGWLRYTKGGGRISIFARIDINWYDEDHPWIPSGDRNRWTRKWTFRAWTRANPYSENETQSNVNYSNGYVARNAISLGVITIRQPFPNPCREFL